MDFEGSYYRAVEYVVNFKCLMDLCGSLDCSVITELFRGMTLQLLGRQYATAFRIFESKLDSSDFSFSS